MKKPKNVQIALPHSGSPLDQGMGITVFDILFTKKPKNPI
jgi:hypothetical protein